MVTLAEPPRFVWLAIGPLAFVASYVWFGASVSTWVFAALAVAVLAVRRGWFVPTPPTRLGRLDRRGAITLARVEPPSPDQRVDTSSSARHCPECTGPNDFLEFRRTINLGCDAFGDFVPVRMRLAHYYRCKRCGFDYRWETTQVHPDIRTENGY